MKKILFAITGLTLGGAERVLVDIANKLSNKYDITIFTIYAGGELEKQLNSKIKIESLIKKQYKELSAEERKIKPLQIILDKKKIYKNIIKDNYEVEIAFLEGAPTRLLSVKNDKVKKIAWVHNDITKVFGSGLKAKLKKKIDKKVYEKYDDIIFVSEDNKNKFEEIYDVSANKEVIYNYINTERVLEKANENIGVEFEKDKTNIITVSRLVEQKAIDRLAKVHAKLVKEGFNHNIYVIGDGPERKNIEKIVKENGIENTFKLLGAKENAYPYMKNADYFALLSKFEGYPMVLLEAQILNKYIILTNTAARETVRDYEAKKIVENSENGIYLGLKCLLQDKTSSKEEFVSKSYNNENIIHQISNLLG